MQNYTKMEHNLYTKLISRLTKKGKNTKNIKRLTDSIYTTSLQFDMDTSDVIAHLENKLCIFGEPRKKLKKNNEENDIHPMPFAKRTGFAAKILVDVSREKSSKGSLNKKLFEEIDLVLQNKECKTLQARDKVIKEFLEASMEEEDDDDDDEEIEDDIENDTENDDVDKTE